MCGRSLGNLQGVPHLSPSAPLFTRVEVPVLVVPPGASVNITVNGLGVICIIDESPMVIV